jgi:hypothetical protein
VYPIDAYGPGPFKYASLFHTARSPLLVLGFAMAAAIFFRQVRYRRMPRLGEWPALVIAAALVSASVLNYAYGLEGNGQTRASHWRPDRWPWAAAWSLVALTSLVLLIAVRRRIPPWSRALGLACLVAALL